MVSVAPEPVWGWARAGCSMAQAEEAAASKVMEEAAFPIVLFASGLFGGASGRMFSV